MLKETEIKERILKRIERMSGNKLNDILRYLRTLDVDRKSNPNILSYAGVWSDLDNDTLSDLTDKLADRRKSGSRRNQK